MNLEKTKEFLKPDWKKLLLLILINIWIYLSVSNGVYGFIVNIIYTYILSCLIIYTYRKLRDKEFSSSIFSFLSLIFGLVGIIIFSFWAFFPKYQGANAWGSLVSLSYSIGFIGLTAPYIALFCGIMGLAKEANQNGSRKWFAIISSFVGIILAVTPILIDLAMMGLF